MQDFVAMLLRFMNFHLLHRFALVIVCTAIAGGYLLLSTIIHIPQSI